MQIKTRGEYLVIDNVLKIRAMFEDYGCGDLDDDELQQGREIIHSDAEYKKSGKKEIDKSALTAAKALPKRTKEEREIRSDAIAPARLKKTTVKLINKYG